MSDESLELAQVQAAFREAEKKFQDLARAAQDLESVSEQLGDAKAVVIAAGTRLGDLADASQTVAEQLADAIRAIEATDPTEIQSRLKELASSFEQHGTQSSELMSALTVLDSNSAGKGSEKAAPATANSQCRSTRRRDRSGRPHPQSVAASFEPAPG